MISQNQNQCGKIIASPKIRQKEFIYKAAGLQSVRLQWCDFLCRPAVWSKALPKPSTQDIS